MKEYDVIIIGSGTAGLSARKVVSKKTQNYLVVDGGKLGTTCARIGCMPSKVLIQVANDFHRRHYFETQGILGGASLSINQEKVMEHVRSLRDRFVGGVLKGIDSWKDEHFVGANAKFTSPNTLKIGEQEVGFKKAIIATGSQPIIPAPWKEYEKYFISTDDIFEQTQFPKSMAIVGLGVIGLEIGQALSRLGVDIVGISKSKSLAGLSDPFMQEYSTSVFSKEFPCDFSGVKEMKEEAGKLKVITENKEYIVDKAMISVGRRPNLEGLDLDKAGVKLEENGLPDYDLTTLEIAGTDLFIAGDVNAYRPLLHEAADEGSIAGNNSVIKESECYARRTFLGITFTSPQVALVGKTYKNLKQEDREFAVGEVSFEKQGRALVKGENVGHMKVYGDPQTGKLLGSEIFGPGAEHLGHLLAWAIEKQMNVSELLRMPYYHPVIEEGMRTAIRKLASNISCEKKVVDLMRCQDHPSE